MALTDNLISYWKLDETSGNALDSHGSNNLTDNNSVGTGTGKINGARDFNGSSQYFELSDNTDMSTGDIDFTFTCWVKSDVALSAGNYRNFIAKDNRSGSVEYSVGWNGDSNRFQWYVSSSGSFGSFQNILADNFGAPSSGVWYFVVVWHDSVNNQIGISVNNGTANTASWPNGVYDGTASFRLGALSNGSYYWDGMIDGVGFWKRVLTSDERTSLYNGGSGLAYPFTTGGVVVTPIRNRLMSPGHIFGGKCLC